MGRFRITENERANMRALQKYDKKGKMTMPSDKELEEFRENNKDFCKRKE